MKRCNLIGLSSGKDSTALWGWALNDSGYDPSTIQGAFCDTENEYGEVYKQIQDLNEYGVRRGAPPIMTLKSMGFLNLAIARKRFPSACARFCTEQLKMIPTRNYVLYLGWVLGLEVVSHSGVRQDESTERAILEPDGFDSFLGVPVRRPLLKWTIDDVWDAHKTYRLPINPLYFQGRSRVGCRLCCMSSKEDIRVTAEKHPEVIAEYEMWESIVGRASQRRRATFFGPNLVPKRFRERYVQPDGKVVHIVPIREAVEWSKTLRGGDQKGFQFMFEEDDSHLPCQAGYCE